MTQPKPDNRLRRIRGGWWDIDDASEVRSSARGGSGAPAMRFVNVGFRITLTGRLPR